MSALTRIPLASLVCPSAPFLAPRLLRVTVAAGGALQARALSSTPRRPDNAAKGKKSARHYWEERRTREHQAERRDETRRRRGESVPVESPARIELAQALQTATKHRNLPLVRQLYPEALAAGLVHRATTHAICQLLHTHVRRDVSRDAASQLPELLPFADQLVSDLQSGRLPPHRQAYVHLLGIYKTARHFADGRALWQWLHAQDHTHVSQAAYGAAIELLAAANLQTLPELEDLYAEGLQRFPGTFAEYHLSPDAIVPDRSQPVHILGLPTTLLQGITTARLHFRDWKKAYLALDTILRLYPAQTPSRFFELFVTQRPIAEAYTAYMLACRSGVQIGGAQLTVLLNRLRSAMTQTPVMDERLKVVRAIANAMYAYQQCGGGLASVHAGQLVKAFEALVPQKAPGQPFTEGEQALRTTIARTAREYVTGLVQSGLVAGAHPFASLTSLAGKLQDADLLKQTLDDAKKAGVTFGPVDRRALLTAAGLIPDRDLIHALWSITVTEAASKGTQLSYSDWITFAKACRRAQYTQYLDQQLQEQAHSITSTIERQVSATMLESEPGPAKSSAVYMTQEQLSSGIALLNDQLKNIQTVLMSGQPLNMEHSPLCMHIDPSQPPLGSEEDLRTIYNELTTDPHQPPAPSTTTPPALSTTAIPLATLRFLNWITVHEMLSTAAALPAHGDAAPPDVLFPPVAPPTTLAALRDHIAALRSTFRRVEGDTPADAPTHAADIKIHKHTARAPVRKFVSTDPRSVDPRTGRVENPQDVKTLKWNEETGELEALAGGEEAARVGESAVVEESTVEEPSVEHPSVEQPSVQDPAPAPLDASGSRWVRTKPSRVR
ncbi:hypothetical protein C7974DRAFT_381780 [Boeremia exigua]|uniref:uncharacterized protein n=1 Tax=Boeremia exigua TaxID=749465 RepID=UPI001E8E8415|nr:uncharacterized protein C7974DRAFT_381780 [Boeremia exigua]KAH6643566.1 hypothetical protein C7974DRAFT_381780 [Boeremia exigua]